MTLPTSLDAVIVGGGAAGLYAALCLPAEFQIGLMTKDVLSLSASDWAQGGIAAAIGRDDSAVLHIEDTLRAGAGLCEVEAVQLLAEQAPRCIQTLLDMGVAFDRQGDGLALTLEAAHSRRRVLHAADTTGRAMVTPLMSQVLNRPNVQILAQTFALDLWMEGDRCQGLRYVHDGHLHSLRAGVVILATGGGGQVFAQTTNPAVSTGDGVAMAWRAGAQVRDLEFVQFHPTALTKPGAPRFLISEAVRGEGAHLIDANGHRFAFDYHPAGELAPRDVVSRAIFSHLQKTAADPTTAHVWLDLRPIPPETIRHRFPNIIQVCQQWAIDVFEDPIPVAPAAHYWMGGITTDLTSHTTLPHLYAIGETASTGVHGANRLASNSLLECLVFGAQLQTLNRPDRPSLPLTASPPHRLTASPLKDQLTQIQTWRHDLPRLIWQSAGISREQRSLESALTQVTIWRQAFADLPLTQTLLQTVPVPGQSVAIDLPDPSLCRFWGETRNLLDIAFLILKSAAFRTESRGGHYRSDYPQSDPDWQAHTIVVAERWAKGEGRFEWPEEKR